MVARAAQVHPGRLGVIRAGAERAHGGSDADIAGSVLTVVAGRAEKGFPAFARAPCLGGREEESGANSPPFQRRGRRLVDTSILASMLNRKSISLGGRDKNRQSCNKNRDSKFA